MRQRSLLSAVAVAVVVLLAAAAPKPAAKSPAASSSVRPAMQRALEAFSGDALRAHVRYLSDDLLEGRGPGTRGDDLAMKYIAAQFEANGLAPAGDNGTYYQRVPLIGISTDFANTSLAFTKDGANVLGPLKDHEQFVGQNKTQVANDTIDSDVIFVGHGVEAPEYKWDDYKGLDTRGKTLVMLVDDPPASASEPDLFKGKARTYYGRWTYKYEIGGAKGAQGVILIHTNDAAGYPWNVVRNSWGRERSYVARGPNDPAL